MESVKFRFEALNTSGQELTGTVEAETKEAAVAKVRGMGYFPTKVRQIDGIEPSPIHRQIRWHRHYSLTLPLSGWLLVASLLLLFLIMFIVAYGGSPA